MADESVTPIPEKESGTQSTKQSKITPYLGTVAADKEFKSREIKVHISEFLPYLSGELNATEVKAGVGTTDERSDGGEGKATVTNTVTAIYANLCSNRYYPPDVRRGERVFVFNIADTDTYYWFSLGVHDNLRRCEKYRLSVSDDVNYQKELSNDNSYYIEVNTLDGKKEIVISTAKSDGEEYRYLIKIDAKASTLQINDDNNNMILMESKEKRMFMRNTEGCSVDLNKKNSSIIAIEDLILKAGRQIVSDSPVWYDQQDKRDKAAERISDNIHFKANNSIVLSAPMIGLNGISGSTNVTLCGTIIGNGAYFGHTGVSSMGCGGSGSGSIASASADSSEVSTFVAAAASLFTTSTTTSSETTLATTGISSFTNIDYNNLLLGYTGIEEGNRPSTLRNNFINDWNAYILRSDPHYHTSNSPAVDTHGYFGVEVNIKTGRASTLNNTVNTVDSESGRHVASWDQITAAFDRISVAINCIKLAIRNSGYDYGSITYELLEYADQLGVEARVLGYNSFMGDNHGH